MFAGKEPFAMAGLVITIVLAIFLTGCGAKHIDPTRPMSRDLPLSYVDIAEIKIGAEKHGEIVKTNKFYGQPELNTYITNIGYRIASVSERPHLPYRFFIIDNDDVDMFSVGGGYIYITRGLLEFVQSEAELAAVLAHEIAHISSGAYTPSVKRPLSKKGILMKAVRLGAGAAAGAAGNAFGGPAGTVASGAVDGIRDAVPEIRKYFQKSDELEADRNAIFYLMKANYDPRELVAFLDKLSKVEVLEISRYINFMNSHPPYQERREAVRQILSEVNFEKRQFELRDERFASIRTVMMHFDNVPTTAANSMSQLPPVDAKVVS